MSFQHFRLGDLALHQPPPLHHNIHPAHHQSPSQPQPQQQQQQQHQHQQQQPIAGQSQFPVQIENPVTTFSVSLKKQPHPKQPYGSGDADDGYTLVFANINEFNKWRQAEEERTMCEFVKGDTHGSKAVPPRFKDHTKLVCARHSRSGRKKYIKKHPERVRKVPSRKLEVGCPASISYKTYYDTEEVRACYMSQHSHEIGAANLPFTRRGRREVASKTEKERAQKAALVSSDSATSSATAPSTSSGQTPIPSSAPVPSQSASSIPQSSTSFTPALSLLTSSPTATTYQTSPQTYTYNPAPDMSFPTQAPSAVPISNIQNDRWENMATLFQAIRQHARSFEYPSASVAALETVLLRLYLESPVSVGTQQQHHINISNVMANAGISERSTAANVMSGRTDVPNGSATTEDAV